jgi:beta-xylosidase
MRRILVLSMGSFRRSPLGACRKLLNELGVKKLRTGLSWADSFRPGADRSFDHQMKMLDNFDVTVTFCFTPEHCGILPNHTSPPKDTSQFADFCARMIRRYAA